MRVMLFVRPSLPFSFLQIFIVASPGTDASNSPATATAIPVGDPDGKADDGEDDEADDENDDKIYDTG